MKKKLARKIPLSMLCQKCIYNSKNVSLRLPTDKAATREHFFPVYHQIQMWLGNEKNPVEWDGHIKSELLFPILLKGPLITKILLNLISCNYTKGCTNSCGCRKYGLKCSMICAYCRGNSYLMRWKQLMKMILNQYQMKIIIP